MIYQFGNYKVDIDAEETRRLYETADTVTEGCDCQNCRNFYHAVDALPQPARDFFEKLGIDLRRAFDATGWCREEDGTIHYTGIVMACGSVLEGESLLKRNDNGTFCWNEVKDLSYQVADRFYVIFRNNNPFREDFPMANVQIDFMANIPWVLDEEYTGYYAKE